jgi:hypothetical protein
MRFGIDRAAGFLHVIFYQKMNWQEKPEMYARGAYGGRDSV